MLGSATFSTVVSMAMIVERQAQDREHLPPARVTGAGSPARGSHG